MKYWRGFLTAAILAVITFGFMQIAGRYTALVDMVYPYLTRTVQNYLAEWTATIDVTLWQLAAVLSVVALLATVVLMIVLKWNFFQWLGWVLSAVSLVVLMNTCVYGLNRYAGPLADDLRMDVSEFSVEDLEDAAIYFRDQANAMAMQMDRDGESNLIYDSFEELAEQAGDGYTTLMEEKYYSVFSGTRVPVKELAWADLYTSVGVSEVFFPLTGEAAVNPNIPAVGLPFAMCHSMAHRLSIASDSDADFAAFLACVTNENPQFRYAAYFMAYRVCMDALSSAGTEQAAAAAARIRTGVNSYFYGDMKAYDKFFSTHQNLKAVNLKDSVESGFYSMFGLEREQTDMAVLLTNWYITEQVLPYLDKEEVTGFDPMDESQVDISDIIG